MKLINRLKGMPVIDHKTGRTIGKVEQGWLHAGGRRLQGISIKAEGLRATKLYASMEDIRLIGHVSIIVTAAHKKTAPEDGPDLGARVWNTEGEKLGWLTNAMIEEETGNIQALEVSRGYFDDVVHGRIWVNEFTIRPCGVIAVSRAPG